MWSRFRCVPRQHSVRTRNVCLGKSCILQHPKCNVINGEVDAKQNSARLNFADRVWLQSARREVIVVWFRFLQTAGRNVCREVMQTCREGRSERNGTKHIKNGWPGAEQWQSEVGKPVRRRRAQMDVIAVFVSFDLKARSKGGTGA